THVLAKPVRIRMLTALLERLEPTATPAEPLSLPEPVPLQPAARPAEPIASTPLQLNQSLGALRGFSAILTHSLDGNAMLKQFLLLLRALIGINRAAIFLHQPSQWLGQRLPPDQTGRLRAACAIVLSPGLLEHFELSFESGIGGQVTRLGRILRR